MGKYVDFFSAFHAEYGIIEIFSVKFTFVEVIHSCTLVSTLLQYHFYKNYTFFNILIRKMLSKFTLKHNQLYLATVSNAPDCIIFFLLGLPSNVLATISCLSNRLVRLFSSTIY